MALMVHIRKTYNDVFNFSYQSEVFEEGLVPRCQVNSPRRPDLKLRLCVVFCIFCVNVS